MDAQAWLDQVCAGSEMGELVRTFDWASTPLGAPSEWSTGLRAAVGICMSSRYPMLVVWGPELTKIYNDGYRPILGNEKHPAALGAPAGRVWPEIWDLIGPLFREVLTTGRSTWHEQQLLELHRNGYTEECWFDWSYSPLWDDDGSIGGVLDVVNETTGQVLAQRRLACVSELGTALFDAEQVTDVCQRAVRALAAGGPDVRASEVHLRVGEQLVRVASSLRDEVPAFDPGTLDRVLADRAPLLVGDSSDRNRPAVAYVAPLAGGIGGIEGVDGVIVLWLNQGRPFDDAYDRFVRLVASTLATALQTAYRRAVQLGEYRQVSDTLQAAMLQPASDLPTVAARYLPAVGSLAVGGDWYDVIDVGPERRALVVGDCVGHGLAAATVMGQLRSAARAMLLNGRDPASTLDGLDRFASSLDGAMCTTVVCAVFDRRANVVTYSRAGHLPPLVVGRSGSTWLDRAGGMPLGIDAQRPRENSTHQLNDDDVIIMCSDGLVERRGELLDEGLERLARAARDGYGSSVQAMADGLLRDLRADEATDDVVLVVKHLPGHAAAP